MPSLTGLFLKIANPTSGLLVWNFRLKALAFKRVVYLKKKLKMQYFLFYSPSLTWRDMQHVIARSARSAPGGVRLEGGDWIINNASLAISKYYGFGLIRDAGKMVYLAKHWNRVPQQLRCEIKGQDENRFEFSALF